MPEDALNIASFVAKPIASHFAEHMANIYEYEQQWEPFYEPIPIGQATVDLLNKTAGQGAIAGVNILPSQFALPISLSHVRCFFFLNTV